ncbi:hypothetical protein Tco_0946656, partial [Tanacetum coccineum]
IVLALSVVFDLVLWKVLRLVLDENRTSSVSSNNPTLSFLKRFKGIKFTLDPKLAKVSKGLESPSLQVVDLKHVLIALTDLKELEELWVTSIWCRQDFAQEQDELSSCIGLDFKLHETMVGCTRDILRQRDCLDQFSEVSWVIRTFFVIEGERFTGMLLEYQDVISEFSSPSRWKELSKETRNRSSQVEMDLARRRSSQLLAWRRRKNEINAGAPFPYLQHQVQMSPQVLENPQDVGLDPRIEVHGMSIRFAPTEWCQIGEALHCYHRGTKWCFDSPRGKVGNNHRKYG